MELPEGDEQKNFNAELVAEGPMRTADTDRIEYRDLSGLWRTG